MRNEGGWDTLKSESSDASSEKEESATAFAKRRALEYLDKGEFRLAINSMVSDLDKDDSRPEQQKRMIAMMGMMLNNKENLAEKDVRDFIEGFAG